MNMDNEISQYSRAVGIPEADLLGMSRKHPLPTARHIHWRYLQKTGFSYEKIGILYGRHRTTIMEGVRNVTNLIETRDSLVEPYLSLFLITQDEPLNANGTETANPIASE